MYSWQIVSGICICGCSYEDHHLNVIMNWPEDLPADHPPYVPEECERYGCNEFGGLIEEEPDCWYDHCHQYKDKDHVTEISNTRTPGANLGT